MFLPARRCISPESVSTIEEELVERAQAGDEESLELLFGLYNTRISIYLARMVGNDEIGRELAQETFLKAWQSLPRLRDAAHFASWLYRIATNIAYDHLRRSRPSWWLPWERRGERRGDEGEAIRLERNIEEAELLTLALRKVTLTYRACVILQIVEELPQRQIARLLGIKENSVSKYVSRGLHELRQAYLQLTSEPHTNNKEE